MPRRWVQANDIFLGMNENIIYFTIYDKLMLSRKLEVRRKTSLIDFDWVKIKLTPHEAWLAPIDQMLKMTLAPPGGCK